MLYTLNLYNATCQLYPNKTEKKKKKRKTIFSSSTSFLIKIFATYQPICPYLFRSPLRCVFPLMTLDSTVESKLLHSKNKVFMS